MAIIIEKRHVTMMVLGILILLGDFLFYLRSAWFIPFIIVALTIGWSPFWIDFFVNTKKQKELESLFPDFVRNLVGAIKSGMPVGKAIIYVSQTDYGALTPYVVKLANQVEWSIPIHKALHNFAKETKNEVIKRSISTVIEAEMSGGNIEDVLETVTNSVIEIKTIKLERKASIHSQLVQSYVIFLVFLGVMVIIQNMLIPYIANIEAQGAATDGAFAMPSSATGSALKTVEIDYSSISGFIISMSAWLSSIKGVFLMLAVIQAFFAGLVLGKLSEGDMISGLKHSLILMTVSFFIISLAQGAM